MAPTSSSSSTTASRRRPRKRLASIALSATAALALISISPVHAAGEGGVRGGAAHSRRRAQHEPHEYDTSPHKHLLAGDHSNESYRRYLLADEENLVGPSSFTQTLDLDGSVDNAHDGDDGSGQRKLGSRNKHGDDANDNDGIVPISPFTTTLLSIHFPYSLKCNTNQQCSSITTTYLASYLNGAMGGKVDMLGLDCTKSTQKTGGGEDRHVLSCEGQVTFTTTSSDGEPPPKRTAVNSAVRNAFLGEAKHEFLQQMYAKYEILREKSLFDNARTSRTSGSVTRGIQPRTAAGARKVGRKKRNKKNNKKVGKKKKNGGDAIQGKMLSFVGGGGGSSNNKKKKKKKNSKPSSSSGNKKKNVHNIEGSGKNAFGYQSGKANTGPKNSDTDKKGNIIVKVGGGR